MTNSYAIIISYDVTTIYSAYLLLKTNHPPKGILVASPSKTKLKSFEKILIKKYGFLKRISQIAFWPLYKIFSQKNDSLLIKKLYKNCNFKKLERLSAKLNVPILKINSFKYDEEKGYEFIKSLKPDFLVVHSHYWVSKKMRDLAISGIVIGSHPGIVPYFRGSSSCFWSRFKGKDDLNGFSIILINSEPDAGEIIKQKIIPYNENYSFIANDIILLKMISEELINVVGDFVNKKPPKLTPQKPLLESQIYIGPGFLLYILFYLKELLRKLKFKYSKIFTKI